MKDQDKEESGREGKLPSTRQRDGARLRRNVCRLALAVLLCGLDSEAATTATSDSGTSTTPGKMLKIVTRSEGGVTHLLVQNLEAAEVTGTIDLQLSNLKASTNLPFTATFPGKQTVEAFTLTPLDAGKPWHYSYTNHFTLGSKDAVHDDSYVYSLPYEAGAAYHVSQGYHGPFSHSGPDEYAIDWKMPMGTPVLAARDGVVVKSKDDSDRGGPDRKFETSANCILIQHPDGTLGIYAHLRKGGNLVKVGDKVKAGDLIGASGNTGFTSGPHLHFSVFKAKSGSERESLPVKFRTVNSSAITLLSGQTYQAAPNEAQQVNTAAHLPGASEEKKRAGG
jgi:murein DD-endopeptidase MepM/ murein hydrolase activator NlpD